MVKKTELPSFLFFYRPRDINMALYEEGIQPSIKKGDREKC